MQQTDLFEECPECHSGHILYDHNHDEIFCYDCGLVLLRNYSFYILLEDI
ncbi:TFIIB-type zinc ribbon-containing protein [Methanobrevibacter boviskoreani]|nr:TFIIB-type zinc ribbon-containing protein [Methanobrevibacter boviskoreani]